MEADGQLFTVYALHEQTNLAAIVQNESSLSPTDAVNVFVLLIQLVKKINKRGIFIKDIRLDSIFYSKREPALSIVDITGQCNSQGEAGFLEQTAALKDLLLRVVPWVEDEEMNEISEFLSEEEKNLLSLYRAMRDNPLEIKGHPIVNGTVKIQPITQVAFSAANGLMDSVMF